MPNLSQVELQNLRHLIGAHETSYQKTKHICFTSSRPTN